MIALYQFEREIEAGLRPEIENITIHYSDSQGWRLDEGIIMVRTHRGWAELHYRGDRQLWRHLYRDWRLSSEPGLKVVSQRIMAYLSLEKG